MEKPTYISLFCGAGGFDLGFSQNGFNCLGAFDNDPWALETYNNNFDHQALNYDLGENFVWHNGGRPDVIIAGPPCQGFSTVGLRKFEDPRNSLLVRAGTIALELKPKLFIMENVPGVLSGKHKSYLEKVTSMFKDEGYNIHHYMCKADEHGLAQRRRRVFFFAWKGSEAFDWNLPKLKRKALGEVLNGAKHFSDHEPTVFSKGNNQWIIASKIKPGQKLSNCRGGQNSLHTWDIPTVFGSASKEEKLVLEALLKLRRRERKRDFGDADPVPSLTITKEVGFPANEILQSLIKKDYVLKKGSNYDLRRTFNGKFRRLREDDVSATVDTRFGDPGLFLHPKENRGFSVREAAKIQGFSDDFKFSGSRATQFKLIGNAVPPPLGKLMAKKAREFLR